MIIEPGNAVRKILEEKGLQLADASDSAGHETRPVSILIGSDFYWKVVLGRVEKLKDGLVALENILGWYVQGPSPISTLFSECQPVRVMTVVADEKEESISSQLHDFWEIESIGILDKPEQLTAVEESVLNEFESSIEFKNGRYEVRLPWKEGREPLADNFSIAKGRIDKLIKRFKYERELYKNYSAVVKQQEIDGIVKSVGLEDMDRESKKDVYYMPHRAVIRENHESTKLRIVFDALSHSKDFPSLNDCLHKGPNLNPDLLTVLLRFREYKIGLMADVEKAFLQISLLQK